MTAGDPREQLFIKTLERKHALRRLSLWLIGLLLTLPIGGVVWLLLAGHDNVAFTSDTSVSQLRGEIARVDKAIVEQAQARQLERAQVQSAQDDVLRSLKGAQETVARFQSQSAAQTQSLASERLAREEIEKRNAALDAKLREMASNSIRSSDELKSSVAALSSSLLRAETANVSLSNNIVSIRASLTSLQSNQNEVAARLASIESSVAKMNATVTGINGRVTELDQRMTKLEGKVAEITKPSWFRRMLDRMNGKSSTRERE